MFTIVPFYKSMRFTQGFQFSYFLTSNCLLTATLSMCTVIHHWDLDLHSLEDIGHLYLIAIHISFWSKLLLKSFVHFKTSLIILLLIYKSSLYMYDINSSPEINFANFLLCSTAHLFPLLTMLSDRQGFSLMYVWAPFDYFFF